MVLKGRKSGFTLMELLIGIILFVSFFGIVAQSYVNVVRAQKGANEVRRMYSEVRNVMDVLSEEIRLGVVDYECMNRELNLTPEQLANKTAIDRFARYGVDMRCNIAGGSWQVAQGESKELRLIKKGGRELTVLKFLEGETGEVSGLKMKKFIEVSSANSVDVLWQAAPGYEGADNGGFIDLLSDALSVKFLSFSIYPQKNPYTNVRNNAVQFQPKVTIFLSVENSAAVGREERNKAVDFRHDFQTTVSSRVYSEKI